MTISIEHLLSTAIGTTHRGTSIAFHPPVELGVRTKANHNDLVTTVDKATEANIASHPHAVTGSPLLGEEGHAVDSFVGLVWIFDPINGTMNYAETHRDYTMSLALCEDGILVLGVTADVVAEHIYHAIRGQGT